MKEKKKLSNSVKFSIIAVVLICIFCIAITPVTFENDTFYTIKIGEHIQNNGIDMKDPFSWHENLSYTYPHWLYDLVTYNIYVNFGFQGIYITTVILSCIFGISIYFVNCKISKSNIISFIVTIGTLFLVKDYMVARAQLVTFILFILTIFCIEKFLEKRKIGYAIGIICISTLIANLHCAVWPFLFVLFLPYIGEYIIAVIADCIIYKKFRIHSLKKKLDNIKDEDKKLKIQEEYTKLKDKIERVKIKRAKNLENPYKIKLEKNKNVRWLILVMIICAFTGLLTPIGDTPYTYLVKTMQGNTTQNINEHLPMTPVSQPEPLCAIIIFISILTFTKTKIKLRDLFMLGGLCYLMLASRRQLTMFALIGSPILCKLIYDLINGYNVKILEKSKKYILKPIPIIIITVLVGIISYDNCKDKFDDTFVDISIYPVEACDYILNNIDLSKARFYNEYNYGSYLIYRGIPVFIDSRADLYAPEFSGLEDDIFTEFIDVSSAGTYYEDLFEKYGITHAIMTKNAKIAMLIDESKNPKYKKIHIDDNFVIYERQTNKN